MSNILLKILIVVSLILAWLVFYSYKLIHEKPIHEEESVVVKSVVMPHPPLSDKSGNIKKEEEVSKEESNENGKYIEGEELNSSSIELTPNILKDEIEAIADDSSLDEPEIVINDETEIIDDSEDEELAPIEEAPFAGGDELEVIEDTPQEQISKEQPSNDLGRRIGDNEEKKQNVDLGVQLF